jgi:hypothetical protein
MTKINFLEVFERLVEAYDNLDDAEIQACKDIFSASGHTIRVEVSEDIEWEESVSPEYEECPVVTQTFKVYLGDELLHEGYRMFGSELVDPTHTGAGGRWETIQVDMGDENQTIEVLEDLGYEIEWPDVPEWR